MDLREALWTALADLSAHKLRSTLAMLGVVFGVGAVIAMLSIGAGAEREAMEMIGRLGVDNIILKAREFDSERLYEVRETSPGLSPRDAEAIREAIPGVIRISPKVEIEPWAVLRNGVLTDAVLVGVGPEHRQVEPLSLAMGRFLDARDHRDHAAVCVIGPKVVRELFAFEPVLGGTIKVDDVWLTVVGVLAATLGDSGRLESLAPSSTDDRILVPVSTALRKFDRNPLDSPYTELVLQLEPSADLEDSGRSQALSRSVKRLLDQLHAGEDDYEVIVPQALLEQSRQTQRLFNLVMGSIAGISLLVGGIGIMNIMLASVMERTREIGVRRAVGARRRDIQVQFVVESFTISLLGGLVGVVVGFLIALGIAAAADWPTAVSWLSIVLSCGVAMVVGVASGLYPAVRASRLDPIESLRYE